mmetsp:Transcript_71737/g.190799  ORF Transcript_71737/g.190799 Transcript_71737/m.190799 type:complete len:228 (-) Transcript_71737:159-842(-)
MLGKTLGMSSCGCWRTPWGALVLETMLGPASIGHRPAIRPRRCYCRRRGPTPLASRLRRPRWWGWASPGWCRLMRPPWKSWSPPTPREIRAPSSMRCPPRASRRRRRDRSAARADRRAARSTRHGRGPCSVPSRSPAPGCPWSPRVAGAASSCRRCTTFCGCRRGSRPRAPSSTASSCARTTAPNPRRARPTARSCRRQWPPGALHAVRSSARSSGRGRWPARSPAW